MPLFRGGARGNPVFGANSPHQLLHRHRLSRQLRLGGLFAFGRRRIQEHAKAGVHRNLRHLWHERVQHLPRRTQPGRGARRLDNTGLRDRVSRLSRPQRGHIFVPLGRHDDRRAQQRHVDGAQGHALLGEPTAGAAGPGIKRGLAGRKGREARRVGGHANQADVDHIAAFVDPHAGQETDRDTQAAVAVGLWWWARNREGGAGGLRWRGQGSGPHCRSRNPRSRGCSARAWRRGQRLACRRCPPRGQ